MKSRNYRDLVLWQKAMDLVTNVYSLTKKLPQEERFALGDQLRRSAVSVPSNIAEGQQRIHPKEFKQFLSMALGSLAEIHTQLLIGKNLGYWNEEIGKVFIEIEELQKMTHSLISKLKTVN